MSKPKSKRWTVVGYWPGESDSSVYWVKAQDWKAACDQAAKQAGRASADEIIMLAVFRGHIKDLSKHVGYGLSYREGKGLSP